MPNIFAVRLSTPRPLAGTKVADVRGTSGPGRGRRDAVGAVPPSSVSEPAVETLPYAELKLEHPALEPDRYDESFFPSSVPYEREGTKRVFY